MRIINKVLVLFPLLGGAVSLPSIFVSRDETPDNLTLLHSKQH